MKVSTSVLAEDDITSLTHNPIVFEQVNFADYMWGGKELYRLKGISGNKLAAESWEVSGHPKYPSLVKLPSGETLTLIELLEDQVMANNILGPKVVKKFTNRFPALVKFFDCQKHMSVQVHPANDIALKWGETDPGKGEVFVVLETYQGAESSLYLGLKDGITEQRFQDALNNEENLLELLHKVKVQVGDVYVLPPGVLHCWTGGTMAVEITEPSDLTYRLFDFGRGRPMHLDKGLASVNFKIQNGKNLEKTTRSSWESTKTPGLDMIQTSNDLRIERISLNDTTTSFTLLNHDTFEILMAIEGSFEIRSHSNDKKMILSKGYSTLIPAKSSELTLRDLSESNNSQALRITPKLEACNQS